MRKIFVALSAAVLACLAIPAASHAGLVTQDVHNCGKYFTCPVVTFTAATGEANDLALTPRPGGGIRMRDGGAPIQENAAGCQQVNASTIDCPGISDATFETGDGNDRVAAAAIPDTVVDLGPGNDVGSATVVSGDAGDDVLTGLQLDGGPGKDTLTATDEPGFFPNSTWDAVLDGGAGADTLTGGALDDLLIASDGHDRASDVPAPDRIDGGPGVNTVSYAGRERSVVVDLAVGGAQGSAKEGDTITRVQNVIGSERNDRLRGDTGANVLDGRHGADRLAGRGGNDELIGDAGRDTFAGGGGDDTLDAASVTADDDGTDATGERLDCGAGADVVIDVNRDVIDQSCERFDDNAMRLNPFPRMNRVRATLRLPCPQDDRENGRCRGTVTIENLSSKSPGASSTRRFKLRPDGGAVRLGLKRGTRVAVPVPKSVVLEITINYDANTFLSYRIKLPKGCKKPTRC